jgi:hypothetical protein
MAPTPLDQLKRFATSSSRAVLGPRRVHGNWPADSTDDMVELYQPQDGVTEGRTRIADIASHFRRVSGEPEDARITGGTRSLMRRLSGLNLPVRVVRLSRPVGVKSVIKGLPLPNANVA